MQAALKNIIIAVIVFAVAGTVITTQITGTDSGSLLIQGIGYLLLGVVVVGVLVAAAMAAFGGNKK
jgi:hypothetical protein